MYQQKVHLDVFVKLACSADKESTSGDHVLYSFPSGADDEAICIVSSVCLEHPSPRPLLDDFHKLFDILPKTPLSIRLTCLQALELKCSRGCLQ